MEMSDQLHAPAALPTEKASSTHWEGGWVDLRQGLNAVAKRKIPCPCQKSNPGRPDRSLVATHTELRVLFTIVHKPFRFIHTFKEKRTIYLHGNARYRFRM